MDYRCTYSCNCPDFQLAGQGIAKKQIKDKKKEKKIMKKKILSVLLAATLVVSLFAGCGKVKG